MIKEITDYIYSNGIIRGNIHDLPYPCNEVEKAIECLESYGLAVRYGDIFATNFAPDVDWSVL